MTTVILAILLVICSVGWIAKHISTLVLSAYIIRKGYEQPTDDEIKDNLHYVVKNMFRS